MDNNNNNIYKAEIESREVLAVKKELASIKKGYRALGPALKNYSNDVAVQEIAKGELVADSLLSFSDTQNGALGNLLKTAGTAQRKMDYELEHLANYTKEQLAAKVLETYESDVKKVLNLKKEQSLARVQHDASLNDLIVLQKKNDTEKIESAKKICVEAKERYEKITYEFLDAARALHAKVDQELGVQLKEYAKRQLEYFQKGTDIWLSFVKHMDQGI
eukprot:Phypoly_transcript_15075.p1 GENE.Phypoly_transcript_15075~~Phypoly_transcript_15075.p1  ORF type:complete len:219 (+),score=51.35 Phypoly_transcript_15075:88-744(+)